MLFFPNRAFISGRLYLPIVRGFRAAIAVLAVMAICVVGATAGVATPGESNATADTTVSDALNDSSGSQTVIVRLSERSPSAVQATAQGNQVAAMKAHANDTQSPFERFAEGNPHVEIEREFWITNAIVVTVDTNRIPLERLGTVDNVERVHENSKVEIQRTAVAPNTDSIIATTGPSIQNDIDTTYGIDKINATRTWNGFENRGDEIRVAVLDTGIDTSHPDLELTENGWAEFDVDGNEIESDPYDSGSHGTHVSGTVAGGNTSGTAVGVAPNSELMHGLVLPGGSGFFSQITAGMQWAVENDADVISMSLGGGNRVDDYIGHIRNARAQGTIVVVSSGNDGEGSSSSPGDVYDSFAVGATDENDAVTDFSSGETVQRDEWENPPSDWPDDYPVPDVAAPGNNVYSTLPDNNYGSLDGTSMAAPHVAGGIALLLSNGDGKLSPAQIQSLFESTAVDIGEPETRQGAGRIDVYAATIQHSRETLSPTVTPGEANISVPTELAVEANHPIDQYYWTFDNGNTVTTTTPTLEQTFETKGTETVSLTLEDAAGENITISSQIDTVDEIKPTASLATNRSDTIEVGIDNIEFNASQSTDNDEITKYEWAFDDGETTTTESPTVTHTYDTLGDLTPTVTVSDASGNTNMTHRDIEVVDTTPPTPDITAPESVVIQSSVTLSATNSTDNDEITQYNWTFDDRATKTGSHISHTFDEAGTETVTLTITDGSENTASATTDITVQSAPSVSVTSPSTESYVSSATPQIEYTLSNTDADRVSGIEYRLVNEATGEQVVGWAKGNFTATSSSVSHSVTTESVADGNYTAEFRLVDTAGETLDLDSATDSTSFAVKSTPPTVELGTGPTTAGFDQYGPNNPVVLNVTVADPLGVATNVSIRDTEGSTVTEWDLSNETGNGERTTVRWNGTDDAGTLVASDIYEVTVTADDGVGNTNERSENITVDTDTPSVAVQSIEGGRTHDGTVFINDSTTADITVTADDGP